MVDTTTVPDEEILTHKGVALLEAVLKPIGFRDWLAAVVFLAKAWATANPSSELARILMYYRSKVGEVCDEQAFIEAFIQAVPNSQEDVMILAQSFERRGLQPGEPFGRKAER